jgi:polygalacturonase
VVICLFSSGIFAQVYNVQDFGAVGDGKTINTKAIQSAIDQCSKTGGRVVIPIGSFLSGTLHLKSGIEIHIEEGGVLKGSPFFKDYPVNTVGYKNAFTHSFNGKISTSRAFIFAEGVHDISLTGKGSVNGNGDSPEFNLGNDGESPQSRQRPCMLLIINCRNVKVYDLFLTNSAYWTENYIGCDGLHLKGLKIFNHTNYNQDGIDIDSRNVLIENCEIDVDDDGICFKNHERKNIVENVVVSNCKIASNCSAIKFGTMSIGGLKNVSISDCSISKASVDHIRHWQQSLKFIEEPVTVLAGIAIESVDGAIVDKVTISDITMKDVQTPIFIVLGNRSRRPVGDSSYRPGQIKNVLIKNVTATSHSKMASSITGYPGNYIENVTLENVVLDNMGKGTEEEATVSLPENERAYPENRMYGQVYPCSGLYVRHAKGIRLNQIELSVRNEDYRPEIVLEDVKGIKIMGIKTEAPAGNSATIRIIKSKGILIDKPVFASKSSPFIELIKTEEKELKVNEFTTYTGWMLISSKN